MSSLEGFNVFSMRNFAPIMGLLFGSSGAHTYPKSGQVAPPPLPHRQKLDIEKHLIDFVIINNSLDVRTFLSISSLICI